MKVKTFFFLSFLGATSQNSGSEILGVGHVWNDLQFMRIV